MIKPRIEIDESDWTISFILKTSHKDIYCCAETKKLWEEIIKPGTSIDQILMLMSQMFSIIMKWE